MPIRISKNTAREAVRAAGFVRNIEFKSKIEIILISKFTTGIEENKTRRILVKIDRRKTRGAGRGGRWIPLGGCCGSPRTRGNQWAEQQAQRQQDGLGTRRVR